MGAAGRTLPEGQETWVRCALPSLAWSLCFWKPLTLSSQSFHLQKEQRVPQGAFGLEMQIITNLLTERIITCI